MNGSAHQQDDLASDLSQVSRLVREGNLTGAIQLLQRLVTENPRFAAGWHLLGTLALRIGDVSSAISCLENAVTVEPSMVDYLADLCRACLQAHRLDQALSYYRTAQACAPQTAIALPADLLTALAVAAPVVTANRPPTALLSEETLRGLQLRAIYQQAILLCARDGVERWWDHHGIHTIFHLNSVPVLRRMLTDFVLRRAGDVAAFVRFSHQLSLLGEAPSSEDTFLLELAERYLVEAATLATSTYPDISERKPMLLAFPVWGSAYIERFLDFCVPSLLAPGNLPALCQERAPILLIHTDEEGAEAIRQAPIMRQVQDMGIGLRFLALDHKLRARTAEDENFKYWHLGLLQSIALLYAKRFAADFHILLPDTLYAADYFSRLLRLATDGHKAILQAAFRTEIEKVEQAVAHRRSGSQIAVAAGELMAIALNCLHPSMRHLRIDADSSATTWPNFHALFWESENALHLVSPHQTIAYLDSSVIASLPERFFFTLDSEIDKVVPADLPIYCPREEDGLVLIELSPGSVEGEASSSVDANAYAAMFWHRVESRKHLKFFDADIVFPIEAKRRRSRGNLLPVAEIRNRMELLRSAVRGGYPVASLAAMQNGLLALHAAETAPGAEGAVAALRDDARRIWESGRVAVTPGANAEMMHNVLRMLWHFDLLEEARDGVRRFRPNSPLGAALDEWQELRRANDDFATIRVADVPAFVVGVTVWGRDYLEFFRDYHLPSLLAPGNLPALAQHGRVVLSIVTDAEGRHLIEQAAWRETLAELAELRYCLIGDPPRRATTEDARTFYMRYGLLDHLHVYLARSMGANLMLMPADTVISRNGLLALADGIAAGFDCCTASCIEAERDAVQLRLDQWLQDGVVAIDPTALMEIAVSNKTAYFKSLVVSPENRINAYPREFFWRVPGGYVCHSIFMHPVMLSSRVMSRDFHPNHENVDWALLPRVLGRDGTVKVLDSSSGLFILHCSDARIRAGQYAEFTGVINGRLGEYLISVNLHNYPIHRRLFKQRQFFAIEDAEVPVAADYLSDSSALLAMFDMATAPSA